MIASGSATAGSTRASSTPSLPVPACGSPPTGGVMALAWLGFLKPVVDVAPVALDGHDALTSAEYAADYREVASIGSTTSTTRTADQTAIAQFFAAGTVSAATGSRSATCWMPSRWGCCRPPGCSPGWTRLS